MNAKKSIFVVVAVAVTVLTTAAGCPKQTKKVLPKPTPVASLKTVIGDGIYVAGVDIPVGKWHSVGAPMDNSKCRWWVAPAPGDPQDEQLASYHDFRHGEDYAVAFTIKKGQGFVTDSCGQWAFSDVR